MTPEERQDLIAVGVVVVCLLFLLAFVLWTVWDMA